MLCEQYSPQTVRDFLTLFRALWLHDDDARATVLHDCVTKRLTDEQLGKLCDAQMLRQLLVYLPSAGENAIDAVVTRLHALADAAPSGAQSAFERALENGIDLLTDEQINLIFKSLNIINRYPNWKKICSLKKKPSVIFLLS